MAGVRIGYFAPADTHTSQRAKSTFCSIVHHFKPYTYTQKTENLLSLREPNARAAGSRHRCSSRDCAVSEIDCVLWLCHRDVSQPARGVARSARVRRRCSCSCWRGPPSVREAPPVEIPRREQLENRPPSSGFC
jgi:hypothetical protein